MRALILALPLVLFTGAAFSQKLDCNNATDQVSMNMCADQAYKASDKALNATYKSIFKHTSKAGQSALKKAEKAWIAYRDAQCAFDTLGAKEGSVYPMVQARCLDGLTQTQTAHLKAVSECEEGDISCGGQ